MANIFQSKEKFINWVVDNYHTQVVNNAISAGLITNDIPAEDLYYVLINAMQSGAVNEVMYAINVPIDLRGESQEVRSQFASALGGVSNRQLRQSVPNFCSPDFQGPLTIEQQDAIDGGACDTSGGFDWDNFADIFGTASSIFTQVFGAITGPSNRPDFGQDSNNQLPVSQPQDNTNMILIIAAIAIVLVLVIVLVARK